MKIKPGVQFAVLTPQMTLACVVVDSVYRRGGYDATITSGSDGEHKGLPVKGGTRDPHYEGKALDFGTREIKPGDLDDLIQALKTCLSSEFVVLPETDPPHVHIQHGYVA